MIISVIQMKFQTRDEPDEDKRKDNRERAQGQYCISDWGRWGKGLHSHGGPLVGALGILLWYFTKELCGKHI